MIRHVRRFLAGGDTAVERLLFASGFLIIGYLVIAPMGFLLYNTFLAGGNLSLDAVVAAASADGAGQMFVNSLIFAAGSALVAMTTGTAIAYLTARTNAPMKPVLFATSLVPLIIPGILFTVAWIYLLSGRIGLFNSALEAIGLGGIQFEIFSMPGMILVEGLHMAPIVFLLMTAAFRSFDPSLEESALMSGASLPSVIRRITLPLVRPALLAGLLIIVVRGLEAFDTPLILGIPDRTYVLTSRIYLALNTFPVRYDLAGAYSLSLVAITIIVLALYRWFSRQASRYQVITGKGYRPRPLELGRWKWPIGGLFLVYFLLVVVAPLVVLVYISLLPFYIPPGTEAFARMSLDNYLRMFDLANMGAAAWNSIVLAIGSATTVMLLMAVVAWIVVRSRFRFRYVLDGLSMFPLAISGVVLGVALIFVYLRFPIGIYGTLWILLIAYVTQFLPYGMRYAAASMFQVGRELEESAAMSGARWWATFRRVVLPLVLPGLLAGWIYVMIVSIRQLSTSILLYSPGTEVVPVLMWFLYREGHTTVLAAVGVTVVGLSVIFAALAHRIGGRVGVRVT